ncbi:integrator complex subunit 4 isoform X1 [Tripterygium wilfordii]|uniref:Integrator complex subunit 4 isoform X1 n=1 Tax=Tripterygium wilfordii TaxID=458696 RepID=A0A7J7DNI4_TRIWF|nr:protein SIEL isoform X1 [Tripterygium wilfordii]KAF5747646.1 integrator complex subunit 4 isoform X1 [Tripterygium wilfordii]
MQKQFLAACKSSANTDKPLSLQTLASFRSHIINPHTSDTTISVIVETLTRFLQLSCDASALHHTLKLLGDLASCRPNLTSLIFDSVRSKLFSSAESTLLSTYSLAVLASISNLNPNLTIGVDHQFFVSLCFGPCVSARLWLLRNAERFVPRPYVLFPVFLGFTKDPFPYVRKVALDGLVRLCNSGFVFNDQYMVEGCYCRAVELLRDEEACVRAAAVRVIGGWGHILSASCQMENATEWPDAVFVQLCSMVRDMSMEVRVEAFKALGRIGIVSDDLLLQTLSKKVLGKIKENKFLLNCAADWFKISASSAAGAFMHGLEDEFYQVRKSACHSLRTFAIFSSVFASEALNLLMDILNDDSVDVRIEALQTMLHMATCEHLKVQEMHMHMFLGNLVDNSTSIRSTTRKILRLVKLPNYELFKLSVDGLLENLEKYPQDEADVFSVLFYMGQSHGNFVVCIINEIIEEIEPVSDGYDSVRAAAFLVLAISAPLSNEKYLYDIPPRIFSYAVTFLGKISRALCGVTSQKFLLAYLSQCSRYSNSFDVEFKDEETSLSVVQDHIQGHTSTSSSNAVTRALLPMGDETSEVQSQRLLEPTLVADSCLEDHLDKEDQVMKFVNSILAKVKDIWLLVHAGRSLEALRSLRACKEELSTFSSETLGSADALAFTLQYLRMVKLLAKIWEHFLPAMRLSSTGIGELELLFGKLDSFLRGMRCRFIGLSNKEVLHFLEVIVVTYVLRLSKVEICCCLTTRKKLSATISLIESLLKEGSIEPSDFIVEVTNSLHELSTSTSGTSCGPFLFNKLIDLFYLKQLTLSGRLSHVKAELDVPDNCSQKPLSFIPGLPVSIPLDITLCNILSESRLWLKIWSQESIQFVFLDFDILGGGDEMKKFTFVAPFYPTPKAVCFALMVCVGMECLDEDLQLVKCRGGPKHALTYLCPEKEVYLSMVSKD